MPNLSIRGAVAVALAFAVAAAMGHPGLVSSAPKAGESLAAPPREMRLEFNEPIEAAFSSVKLVDSTGKEMPGEATRADKSGANTIVVALPVLATGIHKARWSALGRDGHRVKGEFTFSVR